MYFDFYFFLDITTRKLNHAIVNVRRVFFLQGSVSDLVIGSFLAIPPLCIFLNNGHKPTRYDKKVGRFSDFIQWVVIRKRNNPIKGGR